MTCRPCAVFARACDRYDNEMTHLGSTWGWDESRETVRARLDAARDAYQAHINTRTCTQREDTP